MVGIIHIPMQEFQTITQLIPNFSGRNDDLPANHAEQANIQAILSDLLGQSAAFIQPVLFRSGTLIIYAEAAIWGQHIQHRHDTLLQRCQSEQLFVKEIQVKVSPGTVSLKKNAEPLKVDYDIDKVSQQLAVFSQQIDESDPLKRTVEKLAKRIRENHS